MKIVIKTKPYYRYLSSNFYLGFFVKWKTFPLSTSFSKLGIFFLLNLFMSFGFWREMKVLHVCYVISPRDRKETILYCLSLVFAYSKFSTKLRDQRNKNFVSWGIIHSWVILNNFSLKFLFPNSEEKLVPRHHTFLFTFQLSYLKKLCTRKVWLWFFFHLFHSWKNTIQLFSVENNYYRIVQAECEKTKLWQCLGKVDQIKE